MLRPFASLRLPARRPHALAVALAVLALAGLSCGGSRRAEQAAASLDEVPVPVALLDQAPEAEGARVLLVGVDGASWKVIGPMLEAGELPTLARLMEEGAHSKRFDVVSPHSPVAWTSVATGRAPEDHGITDYVTRLPDGTMLPITGNQRRVPALWEVADRHGLESGVVGWWAAWPADPIRGWVVTDHANPIVSRSMFQDNKYWTADPEQLSALGRDFFPPALAEVLQRHWPSVEDYPLEELVRQARLTPAQARRLEQAPFAERRLYSVLKTMHGIDWPLCRVAAELLRERPPDLAMIYFRGPDPIQHYGWDLVEPERYAVPPPDLERDRGLVEGVYRYVDLFLGELLDAAGPETWAMVVSDHGAEPDPRAVGPERSVRPGGHTKAAKGVFFLRGPQVREGLELDGIGPYDVAPTVAWLLGMGVSEELEGRVLTRAFQPDFVASRPVHRLESWGTREVRPPEPSQADEALMENLRSLGYVQ